jgi:hypothetical protein
MYHNHYLQIKQFLIKQENYQGHTSTAGMKKISIQHVAVDSHAPPYTVEHIIASSAIEVQHKP